MPETERAARLTWLEFDHGDRGLFAGQREGQALDALGVDEGQARIGDGNLAGGGAGGIDEHQTVCGIEGYADDAGLVGDAEDLVGLLLLEEQVPDHACGGGHGKYDEENEEDLEVPFDLRQAREDEAVVAPAGRGGRRNRRCRVHGCGRLGGLFRHGNLGAVLADHFGHGNIFFAGLLGHGALLSRFLVASTATMWRKMCFAPRLLLRTDATDAQDGCRRSVTSLNRKERKGETKMEQKQ